MNRDTEFLAVAAEALTEAADGLRADNAKAFPAPLPFDVFDIHLMHDVFGPRMQEAVACLLHAIQTGVPDQDELLAFRRACIAEFEWDENVRAPYRDKFYSTDDEGYDE